MAQECPGYSFSKMAVKDSQDLSAGDWDLQDLETYVCLMLAESTREDSRVLPGSKTITDLFVESKKTYFQQVYANILETKNSFLELFKKINSNIDGMTEEIVLRAQVRKKTLRAQLMEIRSSKISNWNRQLALCEWVLQYLTRMDSSTSIGNTSALDRMMWEHLTKELGFVDAGELKLDVQNYPVVLETIGSLGKVTGGSPFHIPKFIFGGPGNGVGQFCRPWGVCSDDTGRILVCDRSNHRIQIFNESGQFLIEFGSEGSKVGEFSRPTGLAVDKKCRIIVADKDNHRIQVFTYSGHFLFTFGRQGTRPGLFMYPWDVAVNSECNIAVSDSKNHRIQLFTEKGVLLTLFDAWKAGIEKFRQGLKFLDSPRGLAFRPDGSLLVTDLNNHRILLINKKFEEVTVLGSEGHAPGQFFRPQGVACDSSGSFAVADCKNYRIQVFDAYGNFQKAFGSQGVFPGQFDCPQGICFHPYGNLVVVDFNNNRIQVF